MKKIILTTGLILSFTILYATHIVGGNMDYKYLGFNNYAITLSIYRDCFNGVPPFDNPASIGIFDSTNTLISSINVLVDPDSVYLPNLGCSGSNLCIVIARYRFTVNLPSSGIYTLSYQRCCRSQIVMNLNNPNGYGLSIWTQINTSQNNNSPDFINEFPGLAYVNDTLRYSGAATDLDGDSLVYGLDYCYTGGDTMNPAPAPPSSPPYTTSSYQPPYSLNNPVGGNVPLFVNPSSGEMIAFPNTIGLFQIAQKIEEYRNGVLISIQRREFPLLISAANYYNISGYVTADTSTQSLDIGDAWLIRKNLYDSTLTAVDTNVVNNFYLFPSTINSVYFLKASPDSNSVYHSNNLPTYYGDVLYWHQATPVDLCGGDQLNVDINLLPGKNPGGPGFVGGLISMGANRMSSMSSYSLNGCTVILYDMNNQPVAAAFTDVNGSFFFSNIPTGTYKVCIDKLNYVINNSLAPVINVTNSTVNYSFILHPTWLELLGVTGLSAVNSQSSDLLMSPNPFTNKINITATDNESYSFSITDITGRYLFTKNLHGTNEVNTTSLNKGVYFAVLRKGDRLVVSKILKQ